MSIAAKRTKDRPPRRDPHPEPRVITFRVADVQFAVLSVPLHDGAAMDALTNAEREVAALAAAGLSNLAIARCRGKALRTVANQMASIFSKLGVASRYELAARLALCPRREDDQS
jgi:DNA-binding CsgD family transcriptional regulator